MMSTNRKTNDGEGVEFLEIALRAYHLRAASQEESERHRGDRRRVTDIDQNRRRAIREMQRQRGTSSTTRLEGRTRAFRGRGCAFNSKASYNVLFMAPGRKDTSR